MTIPRPAKHVQVDVVPQFAPERVPAEQLVVSALAHGPDPATLARVELVKRVENGGRWFYWIAGLSAVNFVIFLWQRFRFALGTAIDWFFQVILESSRTHPWRGSHTSPYRALRVLRTARDRRRSVGVVVGGLVYAIDGLLFLLVQDWPDRRSRVRAVRHRERDDQPSPAPRHAAGGRALDLAAARGSVSNRSRRSRGDAHRSSTHNSNAASSESARPS